MKIPLKRKPSVISTLVNREYGTPSPLWTSCLILRLSMFSSNRKWALVGTAKSNSGVDLNYDLQWISSAQITAPTELPQSQMKRIHTNGKFQVLYQIPNVQRIRVVCIYDLPHPVYNSQTPQHEFRPSIIALRKPNILTRHDMEKGIQYDAITLGKVIMKNLSWNSSLDQLILSSSKYKNSTNDWTLAFKIFKLHPLSHLTSIAISAKVFPDPTIKRQYGQFRNAEIDGSFLLVMTDKSCTLIYNIEEILNLVPNYKVSSAADTSPYEIENSPPVLFATSAHMDILSFGGSPWMYIQSVNDGLLEVRDIHGEKLIEGGRVSFIEDTEEKISPDYLTFHMDDSNRVIHVKNSDLRILRIVNTDSEPKLQQEFQYSKQQEEDNWQNCSQSWTTTRFGRKVQMKVSLDPALNRGLAFGMESDLDVFFILEMHREASGVELSKVTFYDNNTYEILLELPLNLHVSGDIEDNRIIMEKDILSIVIKRQNLYTHFLFRLTYEPEVYADLVERKLKSPARTRSLRKRSNTIERTERVRSSRKRIFPVNSYSDDDDGMKEDEWRP